MRKTQFQLILICFLSLTFVTSCGSKLPPADEYVKFLEIKDKVITLDMLDSMLSKFKIDIPLYESVQGAVIHAVVIPFDIAILKPGDVTYDEVIVEMDIRERFGTTDYKDTGNIAVLTAIPQSIDRPANVEEASRIAANIAAAVSEISGNVGADQSKKETYARLYRKVTANNPTPTHVSWTFTPFKDEPIFPGTYYVIAVIEVRDQTHEYRIQVHSNCSYGLSTWFGLFNDSNNCIKHDGELILQQPNPPSVGEPPVVQPDPPAPRLPTEVIVMVFSGQAQIQEAVLDAVDWSGLMRNQNVDLVFRGLEGEQIDLNQRRRDLEYCQQLLAIAGYPGGYPGLRLMISPASESLIQVGEEITTNLSDCGLGKGIETFNSYQDAYSILRQISMAGESGLLLSTQVK